MECRGKKVLIVGLGRSGLSAARFLKRCGAVVTIADTATETQLGDAAAAADAMGMRLELGPHRIGTFTQTDLIVISPGVPHTLAPLEAARQNGIPIWGEFELASRFIREPMIGVTGTNGKTTTTTLLGDMLIRSGKTVFVGGNIGNPLIDYMDETERAEWVVAEVSSFQLDTIETFRPRIGVLLNITEDHLDRYENFNAYALSKGRMFINQRRDDIAVLNGLDPMVQRVTAGIQSRKWRFGGDPAHAPEALIRNREIIFRTDNVKASLTVDGSRPVLSGRHNAENIAAAALATLAAGGSMDGIRAALDAYAGLAHRLEYIASRAGVRYVNDSKATNVDAVEKALAAFDMPIVLIMGGRDKGGDFRQLTPRIRRQVKLLLLLGEAADKIASVLGRSAPMEIVSDMDEAVSRAVSAAAAGDVVLLSPGCTSFDQFQSYGHRGDTFRRAVIRLTEDN